MPFYEYRCTHCRHMESLLESFGAPQQKTCPQCGKRRAFKRLISAAGFQLKGEGWYVTDFKNKDKPAADSGKKSDSGDSGDSGGKDSKKTDSGSGKDSSAGGKDGKDSEKTGGDRKKKAGR